MREEGRGVYGSEREEMAEGTRCSRHEKKERPETRWREREEESSYPAVESECSPPPETAD